MRQCSILIAFATVLGAAGCEATPADCGVLDPLCDFVDECDPDVVGRVDALSAAATALEVAVGGLKSDVFDACSNIANDLGGSPPGATTTPSNDNIIAACLAATTSIAVEITAGAAFAIVAVPPECSVDADVQIACEANCDPAAACQPGSVELRCSPPDLSVQCDVDCAANAWCESDVAFNCEGSCNGYCEGSCDASCVGTADCTGTCIGDCSIAWTSGDENGGVCDGECSGSCDVSITCDGECSGGCSGQCTGSCQLDAAVDCGADVRCRGGCDGTFTEPECHGELAAPSCDLDAICEATCQDHASIAATCTEPEIAFVEEALVTPTLQLTLEQNLPILYGAIARGAVIADAADSLATQFDDTVTAGLAVPDCTLTFGTDVVNLAAAAVLSNLSITVSVEASVSVRSSVTF